MCYKRPPFFYYGCAICITTVKFMLQRFMFRLTKYRKWNKIKSRRKVYQLEEKDLCKRKRGTVYKKTKKNDDMT